jgi:hypothetical protein
MSYNGSAQYNGGASYSGAAIGSPVDPRNVAMVGIGFGPVSTFRVGLWATSTMPPGGADYPISVMPYLRQLPEEKKRKVLRASVEDIFGPDRKAYRPAPENAVAAPPRKDTHPAGEVSTLLAQLASGVPVMGSPEAMAQISQALRDGMERQAELERQMADARKRQRTMAALLMLMMEM